MKNTSLDEIHLLVFNIMGTRIGIDTEDIYEILDQDQAKGMKYKIFKFHEQIHSWQKPVVYKSPKVIMIGDNKVNTIGIIIDQLEDIVSIGIESIQPLPPLIAGCNRAMVIWGAALKDDDIILLADTNRLLSCKTIQI